MNLRVLVARRFISTKRTVVWVEGGFGFGSNGDLRSGWIGGPSGFFARQNLERAQKLVPDGFVFKGALANGRERGVYLSLEPISADQPIAAADQSTSGSSNIPTPRSDPAARSSGSAQDALAAIRSKLSDDFLRCQAFVSINEAPIAADTLPPPSRLLVLNHAQTAPHSDSIFNLFRPFGKIVRITPAAGSTQILFASWRSAASAKACVHAAVLPHPLDSLGPISASYLPVQSALSPIASTFSFVLAHSRATIAAILATIAVTTALIFDPLRIYFIRQNLQSSVSSDVLETSNNLDDPESMRVLDVSESNHETASNASDPSKYNIPHQKRSAPKAYENPDVSEQLNRLSSLISQQPDQITLIVGPNGTGKSALVNSATSCHPLKLSINCADLVGIPEHAVFSKLASQINFVPALAFMSNLSAITDAVITASTGAKTGLSQSKNDDVRKILESLSRAIANTIESQTNPSHPSNLPPFPLSLFSSLFGKSIMPITNKIYEFSAKYIPSSNSSQKPSESSNENDSSESNAIAHPKQHIVYPVIIIKDFLNKETAERGHALYSLLADWAVSITSQHLAHVIFVSDNPASVRELSGILPNKPPELFALHDASPDAAYAYLKSRLPSITHDSDLCTCLDALGGRLHDLNTLIQKIHAGQHPRDALSDMIHRAVTELRNLGLHEDSSTSMILSTTSMSNPTSNASSSSQSLPWTDVQFWKLVQILSGRDSVPLDTISTDPAFTGTTDPLKHMERYGLVTLDDTVTKTQDGRLSHRVLVKPGRPLYRAAMTWMMNDPVISSVMGIRTTKHTMTSESTKLRAIQDEMTKIMNMMNDKIPKSSSWVDWMWSNGQQPIKDRVKLLMDQWETCNKNLERLLDDQKRYSNILKTYQ